MIKFIKKLYKQKLKHYYAKRIIKKVEMIENLILERKYEDACKKFNSLIIFLDKKFKNIRTYSIKLLELYLYFIYNKHKNVLDVSDEVIKYIDCSENISNELKKYYKAFIYNIEMISALVEKNTDRANSARENFINNADFSIYVSPITTTEELEELEKKYPIVDSDGKSMLNGVIFNEYSQDIEEYQRKHVKKYICDIMDIINENKRKTIYS